MASILSRNRFVQSVLFIVFALFLTSLPGSGWLLNLVRPIARAAAVFTVNSNGDLADNSPGDGVCNNGAGACTLRAAIQEANALPGDDAIGFDPSLTT